MNLKVHANLTRTLNILLKLTISITIIAIFVDVYQYFSYSSLPPDMDVTEIWLPADTATSLVFLAQFPLYVITYVVLLQWIYQSNKNLRALSGEHMRFSPPWSVVWFLVPVFNLWKPYHVMMEIWDVSHRDNKADPTIVGQWWLLFVVSMIVSRFPRVVTTSGDDAGTYATSALMYVLSDSAEVMLSVVTLFLVVQIDNAMSKNFGEQMVGFAKKNYPRPRPMEHDSIQEI